MSEPKKRPLWLIPAAAGVACLLVAVIVLALTEGNGNAPQSPQGASSGVRVAGEADIGGDYELTAHTGETVTEESFLGRPQLIFFGFTYCPDICPMSLQNMKAALDQLPDGQAERFQPLLFSVDPERDTVDSLAQYVEGPAFPENLIGLTGTPEQVRQAADAYKIYYARAADDGASADYMIDHSSLIYLMDAEGRFVDVFPHATPPEEISARLEEFLQSEGAGS